MKIGLLGGTFDPVHNGHLRLAEGACERLGLDQLIWIPTRMPPHKETIPQAGPEDRARMVEGAIACHPGFALSRLELERPPPSYTIDTVRQLQQEAAHSGAQWYFLIGSDAARTLASWKEIQELLRRVCFAVVIRPGNPAPERLPAGVRLLEVGALAVSASEVRRRVRLGQPIDDLVPESVRKYIEEKGLYR